MIVRGQRVDGVIIWDWVCACAGRPCPKLSGDQATRRTAIGCYSPPPPCIYVFPGTSPALKRLLRPRNPWRAPISWFWVGGRGFWIIGPAIALDDLALVIHRFALSVNSFEFLAQRLLPLLGITLRHGERIVTKQATDGFKRYVVVDEAHPDRMAELVRLETPKHTVAVFDFRLDRPFIQQFAKGGLLE